MKIIRITSSEPLSEAEKKLREEYFLPTVEVSPTWLGAFTSMKVAKAINREKAGAVEVTSLADLIVAISAREIAKYDDVKIIANLPPNSPTPLSIPEEYLQETDLWIFPSERMHKAISEKGRLRNAAIIPTAYFGNIDTTTQINSANKSGYAMVVILTPKPDTDRLVAIINEVDAHREPIVLNFIGKADAATVMPAVRHSRYISHPERIHWLGNDYDLPTLLCESRAVIKADADITALESAIYAFGGTVIDIPIPKEIYSITFPENAPTPRLHISRLAHEINKL